MNTGVTKANEAAEAVAGFVIVPKFISPDPTLTDFNDLHRAEGLDEVRKQIHSAIAVATDNAKAEQGDADPFPIIRLGDLMVRPDEVVPFIIEGLLPFGGTSIVSAKPKTGKTTLLRQLSLSVARGQEFLGRKCHQKPVLYIAVEEKPDEIKKHFRDMGADGNEPIFLFSGRTPKDVLGMLDEKIMRHHIGVVILDTLFKTISINDSNDYAQVANALQPIQDLARRTGCHALCVHHSGKMEREGGDAILGSTAILGNFDTAILLNRDKEGRRTIKSIQRYGTDLDESVLGFDQVTRLSSLQAPKWLTKQQENFAEILKALASQSESVSRDDLIRLVGINKGECIKCINKLRDDGKISSTGRGIRNDPFMFSITEIGRSYLPKD